MQSFIHFSLLAITLLIPAFVSTSTSLDENVASSGVVIIGDTGKDNEGQLSVAQGIQKYCQTSLCNLGMLTGDVVYPEGVESSTDPILETMFDKYYNPLNLTFLIALGNHDYGKYTNDWKRGSYQLEHSKKNPLFYLPDFYYTYETPDAVIAVIDTTRLMWNKTFNEMAQMVTQAHELAQSQNKWFMVMAHHPYLSNGKHGNAGNYERIPWLYFTSGKYVKRFIDRHICGKAQFYITGHEHLLQVFDGNIKGCNTQLIVSGTGASASKLYKRNPAVYESTELGFFHMLISPDVVTIKAINQNNQQLFEQSYSKNSFNFNTSL